jgi:hypothetical protein
MPLQRQNVGVTFKGGVDTKTDAKQVIPSKLLVLENGTFISPGRLKKRNGYAKVGSALSSGRFLASYGNELVASDGSSLFSKKSDGSWVNRGAIESIGVTATRVVQTTNSAQYQSYARIGSVECVLYHGNLPAGYSSSYAITWALIDADSGAVFASGAIDPGLSANSFKVVALGTSFAIFGYTTVSATTALRVYPLSTSGTLGSPTVVSTAISFGPWDVYSATFSGVQRAVVAYVVTGAPYGEIRYVDTSFAVSAATSLALMTPISLLNVYVASSGIIHVTQAYRTAGASDVKVTLSAWDLSSTSSLTTVDSATYQIESVCSATNPATGFVHAFWARLRTGALPADEKGAYTQTASITGWPAGSVTVGTTAYVCTHAVPICRPFALNGHWYVLVGTHPDAVYFGKQPVALLIRLDDSLVVGTLASGEAAFAYGVLTLGTVIETYTSGTDVTIPVATSINSAGGSVGVGITLTRLAFGAHDTDWQSAQLGDGLYINGAQTWLYDGQSVTEQGFPLFPEITVTENVSAGTLPVKMYGFQAIYEWTDNRGRVHRSAPSPMVSITPSAPNASFQVAFPYLTITNKTADRNAMRVVIYRTIGDGSIPYRLTYKVQTTTSGVFQSTITDSTIDSVLSKNAPLYTTGGVIEDVQAPPASALTVYKNRVVLVNAEQPTQLWYSKQCVPGQPVEFSDLLTLNIDPTNGPVTGLAVLDDKLVIFKRDVIFFLTGDGPTDTGAQNDFSTPLLINTNSGCVQAKSVVTASDGVMYQSAKGIYLLNRALQDEYVGADVEAYNSATVRSVVMVPNANEVRFYLSTGVALSYDYLFKQWSVSTNMAARSAAAYQSVGAFISSSGQVYQETPGTYLDDAAGISMRVKTAWLALAGLQGFQRARTMHVLGDYFGGHTLSVKVRYDYVDDVAQTVSLDPTLLMDSSLLGAPLGSILGGGSAPAYQYRVSLTRQKCEAIQVEIQDVQSSSFNEGLALSALTFDVGVKSGAARLPVVQTAG